MSRVSLILALLLTAFSAGADEVVDGYSPWRAAAGGGPLAYVGIGTLYEQYSPTDPFTVSLPGEADAGDLCALYHAYYGTAGSTVSGWTSAHTETNASFLMNLQVFTKVIGASEPNPQVANHDEVVSGAAVLCFENPTSTGADAIDGDNDGGTPGLYHVTPNITPTASPGIIISAAVLRGNGGTWSDNPDTTVLDEDNGGDGIYGLIISYAASSGTGSQGSVTYTSSNNGNTATISMAIH